jgi:ribonuclease HI
MRFKRNKVWLAVDDKEQPIIDQGKVLIKYQLDQTHEYWVHPGRVHPLDERIPDRNGEQEPGPPSAAKARAGHVDHVDVDPKELEKAIQIYTDGACSGNPGPAGIGVVMDYRQHHKEISQYIGMATNNIAELEAIRVDLESFKNKDLPVVVFTDSRYALRILICGHRTVSPIKTEPSRRDLRIACTISLNTK